MDIEEIFANREDLAHENPADYLLHVNEDGSPAGYRHRNTKVGNGVHIGEGTVVMGGGTFIDDNVRIGTNSLIKHLCTINSDVTIGNDASINQAEIGRRCVIKDGVRIMAKAKVEPGCTLEANSVLESSTQMLHGSTLGTGAYLKTNGRMGPNAHVGMGTIVNVNVHILEGVAIGAGCYVAKDCVLYKGSSMTPGSSLPTGARLPTNTNWSENAVPDADRRHARRDPLQVTTDRFGRISSARVGETDPKNRPAEIK